MVLKSIRSKPFNLIRWFSLLSFLSILTLSAVSASLLSRFLTQHMQRQEAVLTTKFIRSVLLVQNAEAFFNNLFLDEM
jgi:hypothetical protein